MPDDLKKYMELIDQYNKLGNPYEYVDLNYPIKPITFTTYGGAQDAELERSLSRNWPTSGQSQGSV